MFDGRFDQHFLEIFAEAQDQAQAKEDNTVLWAMLVAALVVSVALGSGAILLT